MYESQNKELNRKFKLNQAWNITNKYAVILNKHKYKFNIDIIINNFYKLYLNELKSNKLSMLSNKKYIRIWNNLMNSKNKKSYINIFIHSINNNIKNNYL